MLERKYAQVRKQAFPIFYLSKDLGGKPYIFPVEPVAEGALPREFAEDVAALHFRGEALAANLDVLTPQSGSMIVARKPESHLVLRRKWSREKVRVKLDKSGEMLAPVVAEQLRPAIDRRLLGAMLRFALPTVPAGLALMALQVIDRPILRAPTDDATVGIYQANYRLGIFMMIAVSIYDYAWRPFFFSHAADPEAKQIFSRVMTYLVLALLRQRSFSQRWNN